MQFASFAVSGSKPSPQDPYRYKAPRSPPCCRSCPDQPRSRQPMKNRNGNAVPKTRRCRCSACSGSLRDPVRRRSAQPGGDLAERPPTNRLKLARPLRPRPTQRPRQTNLAVSENTVVGDRTLRAQPAAADVMIRIATHMTNLAVTHRDQHTTRVVTITRTRRTNQTITRRPSHQSDLSPTKTTNCLGCSGDVRCGAALGELAARAAVRRRAVP